MCSSFQSWAEPLAYRSRSSARSTRRRCRHGDNVSLETYRSRFPAQFERLHQIVRHTGPAVGTLSPPQPPPQRSLTVDTEEFGIPLSPSMMTGADTVVTDSQPLVPESAPAAQHLLPERDGYRLIRMLGRGQFGEVWLGEAPGGVEVAVKVMRFPVGHKMTQQELRALELMKRLRHTFLLRIHAYWVVEDRLIIVTELADRSLADRFEQCHAQGTGVPAAELVGYVRETAEALDFLHQAHILHRDIKPANVLLVDQHSKVGDFGLARLFHRDDVSVTATSTGTPLYMAPEVWRGKAGPDSDQYSLAMMYAELRTGQPPFNGKSMLEVMRDHLERAPDLGALPAAERPIIERALSKQPQHRYESSAALATALQGALAEPPRPPRRPWWSVAALVLLLAIAPLAVAGIWLSIRPPVVVPPVVVLPDRCAAAPGAKLVACDGRSLYNRIHFTTPSGTPIEFLLITRNPRHSDDPPTFYMMRDKVCNALFAEFAARTRNNFSATRSGTWARKRVKKICQPRSIRNTR